MTEFHINDHILDRECEDLAREIVAEFKADMADDENLDMYRGEIDDRVHEYADGHQWVVYNYKALMLCAHCNTENGEEFADDCFEWKRGETTIYSVASMIAYGEMRARIDAAIQEIIEGEESAE